MIKRLDNVDVVEFSEYLVILKKINNLDCGTPRFEATITYIGNDRGMDRAGYVYRFTGHYSSERMEAEYILNHHLTKNQ